MTPKHKNFVRSFSVSLLVFGLAVGSHFAEAAEQKIFYGEGGFGVDDTTLIIDQRDASGNLTLQFGNSLGESILWNQTNAQFEVSNNLSLGGNQLLDFRIENASSAPTCDGTRNGRMYHNTIDDLSYVCDGDSWNRVDSLWSINGSDAYYSAGKVGIGINPPISTAHIYENTAVADSTAGLTIEQAGTGDAVTQFLLTGVQRWVAGVDNSDSDKFKIASSADLDSNARLTIDTSGNVGIGTNSPDADLDIEAAENTEMIRLTDSTNADSVGFYTGNATPESAVAAQTGSVFLDNSTGTLYVKDNTNDGGNTGWQSLGSGSVTDNSVTNAKLADMATDTIKGRTTAGSGDPEDLTPAEVREMLNVLDNDYLDNTQSAGRLWGGTITSAGGGTVNIAAGGGFIKDVSAGLSNIPASLSDGQGSTRTYVTWTAQSGFSLAGVGYNLIYYDASAGGFSVSLKENFYSNFDFTRDFTIGRVYYDGSTILIRLCGMNLWNFDRRVQMFGEERFPVERTSGMLLSATGTQNFAVTAGVLWAEMVNRFTTDAFDSSGTDRFTYWYRNGSGGWTSATSQSQINNTNYDDGDGTLGTVTNNRYGVHWVYMVHDGSVHVVYGRGDYTLTEAQTAEVPSTTPGVVAAYATLIGKIIIQKSASSFTSIQSAFTVQFQFASAGDHNDLSGIQGGTTNEYYHLTSAELGKLQNDVLVDNAAATITADFDFGGGTLQIPNSTTLPGTCEVGDTYMDTDATSGERFYLCESANSWVQQGGSGGAETNSLETTITGIENTEIFIGTGSNTGNFAALSGDVSMANTGAVTINDSVSVASWTLTTPLFSGKIDGDAGSVDDDDCTGEQGFIWYDDTDSQWEICNANSGTPVAIGSGGSFNTLDLDYGAETITSDFDFGGGILQIPNSTSRPGTCEVGDVYFDTDETLGQQFYICTSSNTWTLQGDGGGAASFDTLDNDYGAESITSDFDFGSGTLQIPNSTTVPGVCEIGDIYMDTDATSGQRLYLCETANNFVLQGDGGGVGSSEWTLASGVVSPNLATTDVAVGGTTLAASVFSIDESTATFLFGGDQSANPTLTFEATDSDTADFGFNTNDSFYFSGGNVGIGATAPASLLEISDTDADPILSITAAHNTDYDPQIQFRTDGTPSVKFSVGVDAADDTFKIYSGTGVGGTSEFSIATDGTVSIGNLEVGASFFPDDSGVISWTDMAVTSTPSSGDDMAYSAQIDGNQILTVYAEADGSGGIQYPGVQIGNGALIPSSNIPDYSLIISNGTLCVDDGGGNCDDSARSAGKIYAETTATGGVDLAEQYPTKDTKLSAGEIAMLDNENPVFVKKYKNEEDAYPVGIISTQPGVLLGGFDAETYKDEEMVAIALTGRIPLKVSDENGAIEVGDEITVSKTIPGFGMKADSSSEFIVAVALEPFTAEEKTGEIVVFLLLDRRQQAEELCIDDVCVGKEELQALLQMVKN